MQLLHKACRTHTPGCVATGEPARTVMRCGEPAREPFRAFDINNTNSDKLEPTARTLCAALRRGQSASAALCRGQSASAVMRRGEPVSAAMPRREPAREPFSVLDIN